MKKILFICPYPANIAPSQRFRFEQYFVQLQKKGFTPVIKPFFSEKAYIAFYQSGKILTIIHAIVVSYLKRIQLLLHLSPFDFIFVHRESAPIGPPIPPLLTELCVAPPVPRVAPAVVVVPVDSFCVGEVPAPSSAEQPAANTTTHAHHHCLVGPMQRP